MALTIMEQRFIDSAIGHLLEFSTEPNSFKAELVSLKTALTSDIDSQHEFFHLRQCLLNPNRCLQGLEKWGGTSHSLGEIRVFLSEYVFVKIAEAAKASGVSEEELEWNANLLFANFNLEDENIFQSQQSVDSGEHPWQLIPVGSTKIYKAVLEPNADKKVFARISIHSPTAWEEETYSPCIADIPVLDSDEDENYFIADLKPEARKIADIAVAYIVVRHLKDEGIIPEEQLTVIPHRTIRILTHKYYVVNLLTSFIDWQQLVGLSKEQAVCLAHPSVMSLMDKRLLTLETAKQLTMEMLQLLSTPYYYAELMAGRILLTELQPLSVCRLLIFPPLIQLIQLNWMKLSDVQQLPIYIKDLLAHPFYLDLMRRGKLEFSTVAALSQQECENLLNDSAVTLLANDLFNFNFVSILSKEKSAILALPTMQEFFLDDIFTLSEIFAIPYWKAKFISEHEFLKFWIKDRVVGIDEIPSSPNIQDLYGYIFGKRLFAIVSHQPFYLDGDNDSVKFIVNTISWLSQIINPKQLCFEAIRNLIILIADKIKAKRESPFYLDFNIKVLTAKIRDGLQRDAVWHESWETAIRAVFSLVEETCRRLQGQAPASVTVFPVTDPFSAGEICKKLSGELRVFFDEVLGVEKVVERDLAIGATHVSA